MLFLLFELDGERYALDTTQIAEVLPFSHARTIPGTPAWVAGVIHRHGTPVPVIDVSRLALGRAAHPLRSTRLVIVHYRSATAPDGDDAGRRLGLILERATQTRRIDRAQFADSGVATPHARWLGPVAHDAVGLVQWIDIRHMLDDDVKALLFQPAAADPAAARP
jgi:chemotaxis-related protein WspB